MKLLFAAVTLFAIAVASAIAQQSSSLQPGDAWILLQTKAVQNDLGVSDEVASKLDSLRVNSRAALEKDYQDAGINPRDFPFRDSPDKLRKHQDIGKKNKNEFGQKGMELLSADQFQRLQQVHFQYRLRGNAEMVLLTSDIAAALKLTDDQRQMLKTQALEFSRNIPNFVGTNFQDHRDEYNAKAIDLLTADQKETLNQLKGNGLDLSGLFPRTTMLKRN